MLKMRYVLASYVQPELYATAIKAWYSPNVWTFVEALDRQFPER